jgi:osmotically-inducible protein OsmY
VKANLFALSAVCVVASSVGCAHAVQDGDDSDPGIKARIEAAIAARKDIDVQHLTVDVDNATVTISGMVSSPEQLRAVDSLIKRTRGVDQVVNNLVVQD